MKAIVVTDRAAGTAGMTLVERPEPDASRLASLEGANYGDVVAEVHASGFTGIELEWPSTWIDRLGRDRARAGLVTAGPAGPVAWVADQFAGPEVTGGPAGDVAGCGGQLRPPVPAAAREG
jgi:hypothetical protein